MTREEAINHLQGMKDASVWIEETKALDYAIKALKGEDLPNGKNPRWNDVTNASAYRWVLDDAITTKKISPEELSNEYINDLTKTAAKGTARQIALAYFRGQLRGIRIADEMKNTYTMQKAEPRPAGTWKKVGTYGDQYNAYTLYSCSNCGKNKGEPMSPFCPECGADKRRKKT